MSGARVKPEDPMWADGDRHVPCDYAPNDEAHDGGSKGDWLGRPSRRAHGWG
jgi:hypothetical protein